MGKGDGVIGCVVLVVVSVSGIIVNLGIFRAVKRVYVSLTHEMDPGSGRLNCGNDPHNTSRLYVSVIGGDCLCGWLGNVSIEYKRKFH